MVLKLIVKKLLIQRVCFEKKVPGTIFNLIVPDTIFYYVIQPSILIHPDHRLQILSRSKSNSIVQAYSSNNGDSWGKITRTNLLNPNCWIDAITFKNGWHLLVYNPTVERKNGRAKLNVAVSMDGLKWTVTVILENEQQGKFIYPAVIEAGDRKFHITYTYNRVNIKYVVLKMISNFKRNVAWNHLFKIAINSLFLFRK